MKKLHFKFMGLLLFLALGTIILLNAQTGEKGPHFTGKDADFNSTSEDIGNPTDDDPWSEMDKLVAAYHHKQGSSFKGLIKLIDDNGPEEKILEEMPFQYSVLNGDYYYSLGKVEVIKNKKLLLVADHENKIISLTNNTGTAAADGKFFDITSFRKMMEETKAVAKITQNATEKMLTIENIQDSEIQGYRIYYNPETYRITKMLIGMVRLNPIEETIDGTSELPANTDTETGSIDTYTYYMEIIYTDSNLIGIGNGNFNPENKFLLLGNKRIQLNKAYSEYQLVQNNEDGELNEANVEDK